MSAASARALLERAQSDPSFRERLESASTREEKRQVVVDAGYDVTPDDLGVLRSLAGIQEVSDDDLERIAGGSGTATAASAVFSGTGVVVGTAAAIAAAVAI